MKTHDFVPSTKWRIARRLTQTFALLAIFIGPILGGWQRAERGPISAWQMRGWDLPEWLADLLPEMSGPTVHSYNQLVGGGATVEYFGIPIVDPTGVTALSHLTAVGAWLLPVLLAIVCGRVFCGWFCPFGTIARGLDRLLSLSPWKFRGFDIPAKRPVRWVVLSFAVVTGAIAGNWIAFVFLPHALFQSTVYALLLLGGIGAVGGAFLGLLAVGILFGPTIYCAAICPTGAALGALGKKKQVNIHIVDLDACGPCTLCHRACWLGLEPTGRLDTSQLGAGSDCDMCARCFTACPKANMVLRIGTRVATVLLVLLVGFPEAHAQNHKPTLVLAGYNETDHSTISVSVVDLTGVQHTLDSAPDSGCEISIYAVAGPKNATELEGHRATDGEVYRGRLTVHLEHDGGVDEQVFDHPNAPRSAPRRTIYRRRLPYSLRPGDTVSIDPIPGISTEATSWVVPEVHPARGGPIFLSFLAASLIFGGLLAVGLGAGHKGDT